MQGIYTYIPETNYVPREYSVAAILLLLFMVLVSLVSVFNLLYFYISIFRSMCAAPNMTVFCTSLTSCCPSMLLTYFLNDFEIVPVAPIITGITFVFTFHMRCISVVRSLYFRIFSASSLITFLSREIATSINIHVPLSLSRIISSGLLLLLLLLQENNGTNVDVPLCSCNNYIILKMTAIAAETYWWELCLKKNLKQLSAFYWLFIFYGTD